jgi:hypothetical protein
MNMVNACRASREAIVVVIIAKAELQITAGIALGTCLRPSTKRLPIALGQPTHSNAMKLINTHNVRKEDNQAMQIHQRECGPQKN